jgi:ribonuclease P protein component
MNRAQRLRKAADFQRVRARRRSWAHPLLVLYVAPGEAAGTRVGVVVGRRVGKAVVRNLVKRRIREAVRARFAELPPGMDLVWIARPAIATAGFDAIRQAVEHLLRRARLVRQQHPAAV